MYFVFELASLSTLGYLHPRSNQINLGNCVTNHLRTKKGGITNFSQQIGQ